MCAILLPEFFKYECVGCTVPSIEIKLRDVPDAGYLSSNSTPQGEVLIRGFSVTQGYFKRPEITEEALTKDGWLCTGDVGQWNPDGTLSIIDRKKNLVKLSGGEYIAIERLESSYKSCDVVSNICVYASSDAKQPMAIVFPREENLRHNLKNAGMCEAENTSFDELCDSEQARKHILSELNAKAKSANFAPMERIQTVILIPEELPLTAAQKIQRSEVKDRYGDAIKKVYP